MKERASWDKLDPFFDIMKNLEGETPDDIKACQLLTTAVTKSLIPLCIRNSPSEMHLSLKGAKSAWIAFIGPPLRRHLSSL